MGIIITAVFMLALATWAFIKTIRVNECFNEQVTVEQEPIIVQEHNQNSNVFTFKPIELNEHAELEGLAINIAKARQSNDNVSAGVRIMGYIDKLDAIGNRLERKNKQAVS